jgi:hypothetical protein
MKEVSVGHYEVIGNDDAAVSRAIQVVEVLVIVLIVVIDGHWRRPIVKKYYTTGINVSLKSKVITEYCYQSFHG